MCGVDRNSALRMLAELEFATCPDPSVHAHALPYIAPAAR
jgi:hypothetical protein